MSFKHRLKKILFASLYYSGIERVLTRLLRVDAAAILMYHGVSDEHEMPREVDFHLSRNVFERQIRVLASRYEIIGMGDLLDRLARGERLNKQVVLTFDDGYRNNLTAAVPILRRYGAPFSVYLATAAIGSGRLLPLNELYVLYARGKLSHAETMAIRAKVRALPVADTATMVEEFAGRATPEDREALAESFAMLSWEEVRELSRVPGAEIGAHTHSHCNLAVEPPESRRRELETCRDMIALQVGKPPRLFAYPFGKRDFMSAATRQSVIDAGFDCAITTERGLVRRESDPYALPRAGNFSSASMLAGELLYFFARERRRRPRSS